MRTGPGGAKPSYPDTAWKLDQAVTEPIIHTSNKAILIMLNIPADGSLLFARMPEKKPVWFPLSGTRS